MNHKERAVIEILVPGLLQDAIHDIICYYLKKSVSEVKDSLKVGYQGDVPAYIVKHYAFIELVKSGKLETTLVHCMDGLIRDKSDIVTEIMKQYELETANNSTVMHDSLLKAFDRHAKKVRRAIKSGHHEIMYFKRANCHLV